jgi:hypothetical protein
MTYHTGFQIKQAPVYFEGVAIASASIAQPLAVTFVAPCSAAVEATLSVAAAVS